MHRRRAVTIVLMAVVTWGVAAGLVWRSTRPEHRVRHARAGGSLDSVTSTPARPARPVQTSSEGPKARWVAAENARPGTTDWRIADNKRDVEIEGFADRVSAVQGDTVTLHVSTTASSYRVDAYRMGYYGGLGGRLVWRSQDISGSDQGTGVRDTTTNMVEAPWQPSLRFRLTKNWPPGVYLLKLVTDTGSERYVPLTIRDDNSTAAYVVQNAVTTWQAYNLWGGYDLYEGRDGTGSGFAKRSRVVSFDRPYAFGDGAADFLGNEYPLVSLVESLGLDVTYWTDVDLHRHPELVKNHKAVLSLGHDEYWSAAMRQGFEDGRDNGVNLVFFGANAVFRQIRFDDSPLGPDRRQVGYKSAREDPMYNVDNRVVTVDWRAPPVSHHEASLVGNSYECNPVKADMVVADSSAWVFEGTGLSDGSRLPRIVGPEYDRYNSAAPAPGNIQILAHSPVKCRGQASYSDMTYYTADSGGGVFSTGTNWWISHLVAPCSDSADATCPHDESAVRITENVLAAFGVGPAGKAHPSVSNVRRMRTATTQPDSTSHRSTTSTPSERVARSTTTTSHRSTTTTTGHSATTTTTVARSTTSTTTIDDGDSGAPAIPRP
jgi:hypothetical protein